MTEPEEQEPEDLAAAEEVLSRYLARVEAGEEVDFEQVRAQHPELAVQLDAIQADFARLIQTGGAGPAPAGEIGRYRVRGEQARGGMGVILRVWDEDLRRVLAMKVLLGEREGSSGESRASSDPRSLGRFLEEAQITGQLDHPGIVPVHELGFDDEGRAFFTMKLVEGRDLGAVLKLVRNGAQGWTVTRALGVLLKVCEAMAYAHDKGVVHRDLKPSNVMVGTFGAVYVMDWGLARVLSEVDSKDLRVVEDPAPAGDPVSTDRASWKLEDSSLQLRTVDGDVVGTPIFMPPEQALGHTQDIGPHSDVYAVGAMLYFLLAERMPYFVPGERPTPREVLQRVRAEPPAPLSKLAPNAPPELVAICEKSMAREIPGRYANMAELAHDLAAYLEGRVVKAYETGALAELRKWIARHRIEAASIAIGGLALVIALFVSASLWARAESERARADEKAVEAAAQASLAEERRVVAEENERLARARGDEILRLSDLRRLRELEAQAEALFPATPALVPGYEAWITRAEELVARLDGHRATLDELRARALPAEDGDDVLHFADVDDAWWHDTLAQLVAALESWLEPERGLFDEVLQRLEFALTVEERTLLGGRARALWDDAVARIADRDESPIYDGLMLTPQLGLVPLGADPSSGLWEFAHVQTGVVPTREPQTGELAVDEESCVVLVLIPGGTARMGAQAGSSALPNYDPFAKADETPHAFELAPFFLSKYELTQGQWMRLMGGNPSFYHPGSQLLENVVTLAHPVEQVDWDGAVRFTRRAGLSLPTEAQWEYAARAYTTTPWWTGEERDSLFGAANLADQAAQRSGASWGDIGDWPELDDGYGAHAPVDALDPNPFGLYHVHGNVWEWCRDAYGEYSIPVQPGDGLRLVGSKRFRVVRGGGFGSSAKNSRSSIRRSDGIDSKSGFLGLRPARPIQ